MKVDLLPLDAVPGVALDAGRHGWAAWLARSAGQGSVLQTAPLAEEVLGLADVLLVALEQLPRPELERVWAAWESDPCPLGLSCSTQSQAAGMGAAVFGAHVVDPTAKTPEAGVALSALGDIVRAPLDAPESNALLVLSILARARWRGAGMVRNPRAPSELLELPLREWNPVQSHHGNGETTDIQRDGEGRPDPLAGESEHLGIEPSDGVPPV